MILDHISNYKRYINLHPAFADALKFLVELKKDTRGGFKIDGDNLFGSVNEVKGQKNTELEVHSKYIDIQYILEGEDHIGWAKADENSPGTEYDNENDYRILESSPEIWFKLPKNHFVIFFPEDAHAPLAGDEKMTKVFMKVKLE